MPEAEVVYSDVKFKRDKGNTHGSASSSAPHETTCSEVRIVKKQPSTELPDTQQQSESGPRCRVTSERAAVFVLSVLLAASLIALALTWYSCTTCPVGWERYGGKCYYFSTNKATWTRSRDECRCQGGDLVKIESREEQEFLEQKVRVKMTPDKFWIGLTDSETEDTWLWTDGSALNSSFPFWSKGEPNNAKGRNPDGEDCVKMGKRGGATDLKCWIDQSCEDPYRSICEKPV
ncbi:immune-related, lectin-like receptor 4 isoform X2 [Gymnodraco acuticeps]|uniref:Immune-related, lectin-like receptor 4 isoform X2 n=1 Tax=Gymnodraco acuticeps TaxID=8218 RepID=A0A6P8T263_GYMAC|nr:immune-related, lectin-like receptor 4 isoform X2 [Gymnodraco acuticeps]